MAVINKTDLLEMLVSKGDALYNDFYPVINSEHFKSYLRIAPEEMTLDYGSDNKDAMHTYKVVFTSLTESYGVDELMASFTEELRQLCGDPLHGSATYTQARHRDHLHRAVEHLEETLGSIDSDVVVAAESLRLACVELGRLTGVISSEEILDVVFKDFCIGK